MVKPHNKYESRVFYRNLSSPMPMAVRAEGAYIYDKSGKKYLDSSGGAAVSCLGHNPRSVISAVKKQVSELAYAHTAFFTSQPAESLATKLIAYSNNLLDRVYFVSGGSEAIETSLKLARQYFIEVNEPKRINFIGRKQSYHGNTLGALAASGNPSRRAPFNPILGSNFYHIEPCHFWRWSNKFENPEDYGIRTASMLEEKIKELGRETVAAFIAEPLVGATMGAVPAVKGYFKKIKQICEEYGVLLILDEVMCGMGRTGSMFAWQQEQVEPDIVCIAKGLGAGIQPIGATITNSKIYNAFRNGSGSFKHGHTYIGHPTACAAGLAIMKAIQSQNLLDRITKNGTLFFENLNQTFLNHPNVGNIRGRGYLLGIELVKDRTTKEPFDPDLKLAHFIKKAAFENGLICYPGSGTVDGVKGDHILLAPPYTFTDSHFEELYEKINKSVLTALFHSGANRKL